MIGENLTKQQGLLNQYVQGKAMVVTNETIAPLYLQQVLDSLGNTPKASVVLPDGEAHKNMETLDLVYDALLSNGFDRGCTVIALGGGVIGDMAGFSAACYQRGVNFIQIPTTLLAQVDSSVGGKTGVNHPLGKNMIGAFHQPVAVLADMSLLSTLPDREFKAGLAEVIKYGFIIDAEFFAWLEDNMVSLLDRNSASIAYAVKRSCEIKADVCAADEFERGQRALLNFGHTFGHAIESGMGYGVWLHGEAISAGMVMALDMSLRCGMISQAVKERGCALLEAAGLPVWPPTELDKNTFEQYMLRDKKVIDGQIRLILLEAIGQAVVSVDFNSEKLHSTLDHFTE
ncbi:UNVERIFIED_CONTAM: hypothetical protein GTU68_039666 [Idotea baltica]|nr:hypothetical protein [Idotea baltica]